MEEMEFEKLTELQVVAENEREEEVLGQELTLSDARPEPERE